MITIRLPWPDRRLSPNARLHWRAKVGPKQDAKRIAGWCAIATPGFAQRRDDLRAYTDRIPVEMRFYAPDKRRRDDDNIIASMKAARDGIADAFGIDDHRFAVTYKFCEPEKPGRVEVLI